MKNERSAENNAVTIEIASPTDAEDISRISEAAWLATYPNEEFGITREDIQQFMAEDPSAHVDRWRTAIESSPDHKRVWVAKDENRRNIGFCLGVRTKIANKIQAIYLLPEAQGKGIGQKLIEEAFNWFGSDKPIQLTVVKYNHKAIEFYKKLGFREIGDIPPFSSFTLPSGNVLPEIKMERE